jgi:hypothetical protein
MVPVMKIAITLSMVGRVAALYTALIRVLVSALYDMRITVANISLVVFMAVAITEKSLI